MGEYYAHLLKKRGEEYSERSDCDFSPVTRREHATPPNQSDLELRGLSTCAHCNQFVRLSRHDQRHHIPLVVVKTYYVQHWQMQEYFCSDDCKYAWYISRLNQLGL